MKIVKLTANNQKQIIKQAATVLKQGGLVIYPTETVYGAGVDAVSQKAVNKLLAYKSRREGKPLSIAVANQSMAEKYVKINKQAEELYIKFLPGPYTIISKSKNQLAQGVASEFNTIGIRIPQYQLILDLVKKFQRPVTATSANISNKKRPYEITDILNNISQTQKKLIDLIIDAGTLPRNEPSTVIDTTMSTPLTVRGKSEVVKTEDIKKAFTLTTNSEQETKTVAGKVLLQNWDQIKRQGLIVALSGELGAGKTIFAKGIAEFLQIKNTITSPTYTYLKEYDYNRHQIKGKFYHLDLWKIDDKQDLATLKINHLPGKKNIIAIEWWDQVESFLPNIKPDIVVKLAIQVKNKRQLAFYQKDK